MATLSLGSGLVNKITQKVFSDSMYWGGVNNYNQNYNGASATTIGMAGYGYTTTNNSGSPTQNNSPSYFSLMKGVVPSAITDVSSNQRSADELVRFTGPQPNPATTANAYTFSIGSDTSATYGTGLVTPNDFIITITGGTATWSALNLSFLPRYPLTSGTPTWFWFRTYGREHNIIGTVGATGSGSDLELQTYENIDSSKQYTLFNATMATFEMTQEINY